MNNNLTLIRWFLQRLTALLLVIILVVHIIVTHFTSGSINFETVVQRIQSSIFWLIFYSLFLLSALFHGINGVYGIIEDYAPSPNLRKVIAWFCWILGLIAFGWGLQVLLTWQVW